MTEKANIGGSIIGVIFLALGLFKFLQGDGWVVWIILGVLFGGVSGMRALMSRGNS